MEPQLQIRVRLEFDFGRLSEIIYGALKPDERFELRGLNLTSYLDGGRVIIDIECSRGPRSILMTLDDLFAAISMIGDVCGLVS